MGFEETGVDCGTDKQDDGGNEDGFEIEGKEGFYLWVRVAIVESSCWAYLGVLDSGGC